MPNIRFKDISAGMGLRGSQRCRDFTAGAVSFFTIITVFRFRPLPEGLLHWPRRSSPFCSLSSLQWLWKNSSALFLTLFCIILCGLTPFVPSFGKSQDRRCNCRRFRPLRDRTTPTAAGRCGPQAIEDVQRRALTAAQCTSYPHTATPSSLAAACARAVHVMVGVAVTRLR